MKRSPLRRSRRKPPKPKPEGKRLGKSKVTKGPLRDPEHLARVREQPCEMCSFNGSLSEAHHIRECFPRTMGKRIGDDKTIPLCATCHRMLHRNSRDFWGLPERAVTRAAMLYDATLKARADRSGGR